MRIKVKQALAAEQPLKGVTVSGWVRTRRDAKDFSFVEINDGSCVANLQAPPRGLALQEVGKNQAQACMLPVGARRS